MDKKFRQQLKKEYQGKIVSSKDLNEEPGEDFDLYEDMQYEEKFKKKKNKDHKKFKKSSDYEDS